MHEARFIPPEVARALEAGNLTTVSFGDLEITGKLIKQELAVRMASLLKTWEAIPLGTRIHEASLSTYGQHTQQFLSVLGITEEMEVRLRKGTGYLRSNVPRDQVLHILWHPVTTPAITAVELWPYADLNPNNPSRIFTLDAWSNEQIPMKGRFFAEAGFTENKKIYESRARGGRNEGFIYGMPNDSLEAQADVLFETFLNGPAASGYELLRELIDVTKSAPVISE